MTKMGKNDTLFHCLSTKLTLELKKDVLIRKAMKPVTLNTFFANGLR